MLTFEEKLSIIEEFPELERHDVSLGRVNFHYEESVLDKKIVVRHLHPNGNGFVYAGHLPSSQTGPKGMVNIRDMSASELRKLLADSIAYLSADPALEAAKPEQEPVHIEGEWKGPEGQKLMLVQEDLLWNIYSGDNLEECFESPVEAQRYLEEERFKKE